LVLTVSQSVGGPVTFSAGGRRIDQDGNGTISGNEGLTTAAPRDIVFFTDGIRQTAADLTQLGRVIEVGMDVDGDGHQDLDPSRIFYFGQSFGANYGTVFLAVEPRVRAGVLTVAGEPLANRQLGAGRNALGTLLDSRQPSLINSPGIMVLGGRAVGPPLFHENLPVIYQFAKGDLGAPNPNTTAILRAGDLADRTLYYRHDLARTEIPSLPLNAHTFMVSTGIAAFRGIALGAQAQIGRFFASDGETIIHPDPARFFEVPIKGPLPEELNYIP
jgi:hypothetical protein